MIARHALYETVYYHKTIHAAEGMVALFLRRVKDVVSDGGQLPAEAMLEPYFKVMAGEALDQRELMRLDDFSLMVLIETLVNSSPIDSTIQDLGRRILSRDLFKIVPTSSDRVSEFLGQPGSYEKIYDSIKPFCAGSPEYYLVVDRIDFSMFSAKRGERSYFVSQERKAEPMKDHPSLRSYNRMERQTRLFTIAGAVESVKKLIA